MSREHAVREAVERFLARVRQETDNQLQVLAAELLQVVQGDARTNRLDVERAAVDVARAVAQGGHHARHDLIARVVDAIRRLDDATSLRGILDALALGAAAEAARVAVLVVDDTMLRSFRHHGFAPGLAPPDMPVTASPVLSGAVLLRQVTTIAPSDGRPDPHLPAFMRLEPGQTGLFVDCALAAGSKWISCGARGRWYLRSCAVHQAVWRRCATARSSRPFAWRADEAWCLNRRTLPDALAQRAPRAARHFQQALVRDADQVAPLVLGTVERGIAACDELIESLQVRL